MAQAQLWIFLPKCRLRVKGKSSVLFQLHFTRATGELWHRELQHSSPWLGTVEAGRAGAPPSGRFPCQGATGDVRGATEMPGSRPGDRCPVPGRHDLGTFSGGSRGLCRQMDQDVVSCHPICSASHVPQGRKFHDSLSTAGVTSQQPLSSTSSLGK